MRAPASLAPAIGLRRYARVMRATFIVLALALAACSYFQDPAQEEATIFAPGNFKAGSGVIDSVGVLTNANRGNTKRSSTGRAPDPNLYRLLGSHGRRRLPAGRHRQRHFHGRRGDRAHQRRPRPARERHEPQSRRSCRWLGGISSRRPRSRSSRARRAPRCRTRSRSIPTTSRRPASAASSCMSTRRRRAARRRTMRAKWSRTTACG